MQSFIQAFAHEAPNVQLVINSIQSGEINQSIVDGTADIGINCEKTVIPIHSYIKNSANIGQFLLPLFLPIADCLILSPQRKPFSLICNEPDGHYQLDMDKYLAEKDIVLNPHMKVQSIEAVKRCVMNNLGIAIVPTYSIGEELKNGSLM